MASTGARLRPGRFLPPDPRAKTPYRLTPQMVFRIGILGFLALVAFAILFFRLWALQVLSGTQHLQAAENNQLRHGADRGRARADSRLARPGDRRQRGRDRDPRPPVGPPRQRGLRRAEAAGADPARPARGHHQADRGTQGRPGHAGHGEGGRQRGRGAAFSGSGRPSSRASPSWIRSSAGIPSATSRLSSSVMSARSRPSSSRGSASTSRATGSARAESRPPSTSSCADRRVWPAGGSIRSDGRRARP